MTARGNGAHPWVQPIIVAKNGTHEETVWLGARASVAVFLQSRSKNDTDVTDRFDQWLAGPFTKTVRRATYEQMTKVIRWAASQGLPWSDLSADTSAALALPPMRYEDMPPDIARLQVSGTDLPRDPDGFVFSFGHQQASVAITVDAALTTGKATAQAAHAAWMWMLNSPGSADPSFPALLDFASADHLATLAGREGVHAVHDAGLTEIAAGSLTAVSRPATGLP